MAITVSAIGDAARTILQDVDKVRWTDAELLMWVNEGRRSIAGIKPSVFGQGSEFMHTLGAGNLQVIAATNAYAIASIDSNYPSGVAVRPGDHEQLDAFRPGWRADTAAAVQNWWPDGVNPIAFWVYPAAAGKQLKYHAYITPTDVTSLSDVALPFDQHAVALVNYVLARMYSKEDEAGSAAKAQEYIGLFTSALA